MTPAEIAANATCFRCISDAEAAVLYLLATIAGMADPATIAQNARCFDCIPDKQAAILYLLDQLATSGAAAAAAVVCQVGPPVAAPASGCGIAIDTSNDAVYIYRNGAWALKV